MLTSVVSVPHFSAERIKRGRGFENVSQMFDAIFALDNV